MRHADIKSARFIHGRIEYVGAHSAYRIALTPDLSAPSGCPDTPRDVRRYPCRGKKRFRGHRVTGPQGRPMKERPLTHLSDAPGNPPIIVGLCRRFDGVNLLIGQLVRAEQFPNPIRHAHAERDEQAGYADDVDEIVFCQLPPPNTFTSELTSSSTFCALSNSEPDGAKDLTTLNAAWTSAKSAGKSAGAGSPAFHD